jgi:hypothetical protein
MFVCCSFDRTALLPCVCFLSIEAGGGGKNSSLDRNTPSQIHFKNRRCISIATKPSAPSVFEL